MTTGYQRALQHVQSVLGLPHGDQFTQDWVQELPEAYRSPTWLGKYLAAFTHPSVRDEERRILMGLVLDVANDLHSAGSLLDSDWARAADELSRAPVLYEALVDYWCVKGEPLDDCFALTPLVRRIREAVSMYSPPTFMTQLVLAEVLAEFQWPAPYELEEFLPDGIEVRFPKCTLFFCEGFESDMFLEFDGDDTGEDVPLKLVHAMMVVAAESEPGKRPLTPGLVTHFEAGASLKKVEVELRNICMVLLTHFQACILGDFSWVAKYHALPNARGK